ncbi:50S ribosomal protein L19e [Candidatus Woesearchaeota archaeon]|nr:50S ribosomal protein L19e [Candidatus Woesearchaeota archaeon]
MNLVTQKRIAAEILKVGAGKIWFDPDKLSEIKEAITKSDIKSLISVKSIRAKKLPYQSRARNRINKIQKRKGLRSGQGSRKGKRTARIPRKKAWMIKIRAQRKFLRAIKEKGHVDNKLFKSLMSKAKGGFFRSERHIKIYLQEKGVFKKDG